MRGERDEVKGVALGRSEGTISSNPETRSEWIDAAKGIGICLVVWGHVVRGVDASEIDAGFPILSVIDYSIYSFHMPLFFFISGVLFKPGVTFSRLWPRLSYLIYCYFLWSSVHIFLQILLRDHVNTPLEIADFMMLPFRSIDQFWFLYALVTCLIVAVVASRSNAVLVGTAVCVFLLRDWLPGMISLSFSYLPFLAVGILVSGVVLKSQPSWATTALITLGFVIAVGTSYLTYRCWFPCLGVIPAATLGIAGVISTSKLLPVAEGSLIVRLGRASLTIYCLHVMFGSGLRILLSNMLPDLPAFFHIMCGTVVALFLPLLIPEWLDARHLLRYFGFSRFR